MRREALSETVAGIIGRVSGADPRDLGAELHDALAELGPLLEVDRAYLVAVDASSRGVTLADEWCAEGSPPALSTVLSMGPQATELEIRQRLEGLGVKSVLMVPARPAGALVGTIFVATKKRRYRPDAAVFTALETVVDSFVDRLVGLRADHAKLAMRDQLGTVKPELPAAE